MELWVGQIAGVSAALCWATASLIFSRVPVPAFRLNLFKNSIASVVVLIVLIALFASGARAQVVHVAPTIWGWLAISSVAGLVVGDTCYFRSIQILGPRLALVVTLSGAPISALLGWLVLDEAPRRAVAGISMTLAGVAWVVFAQRRQNDGPGHFPGRRIAGVAFGLLGALGQALGALSAKLALTTGIVDAFEATFVRLVFAVALSALLLRLRRRRPALPVAVTPRVWARIAIAASIGTCCGIWFSLLAFEHAPLAIATTLTSLSPVFAIPIAALVLRERTTITALLGVFVALAGVALLFGFFDPASVAP